MKCLAFATIAGKLVLLFHSSASLISVLLIKTFLPKSPSAFLSLSQLHRERARRVDSAPRLHPAAAGEQGALGGAAAPAAPPGAAAAGAGGVQAPTTGREAETYRAAEGAEETAGGGGNLG